MLHNILKSKTGKFGLGVVMMFIFIIGLLWINGKEELSVPEKHEAVAMKIPKSEPEITVFDSSLSIEEEHATLSETQDSKEMEIGSETGIENLATVIETEKALAELEATPEEKVSVEPEPSSSEIEKNPIPAEDDRIIQAAEVPKDPEGGLVAARQVQKVEKKTTISRPVARKEQNREGSKEDVFSNTEQEFLLHDIRLSENMKGKVLEIWANNAIGKYKHFILSSPSRLVIDLPGKWKKPDFHSKTVENDLISKIRLWRHENKLRIVSDLKSDKAIKLVVSPNSDGVEFLLITE